MSSARRILALLLVLAATAVSPGVASSTWFDQRVQDRAGYVDLVAPLADDPDVRRVLADATARAAVRNVETATGIELPQVATDLARTAATTVTEAPTFPAFWRQANEDLHRQVLDLLDGGFEIGERSLYVDARPLLAQVFLLLREAGVPIGSVADTPLQVPVVDAAAVMAQADTYRAADTLSTWLPVLWIALAVLAVLVAVGWRGRVRTAGAALLGLALGSVLVRVLAGPVGDEAVQRARFDSQELARVMADTVVDSLGPWAGRYALVAGALGVLALLAGLLPARRDDHGAGGAGEPGGPGDGVPRPVTAP